MELDQKLEELNSGEMSELLKESLVNQSLVEKEIMDQIISERDKAIDEAKKQIQATCYLVDYQTKKLRVFDTYTNQDIALVELPNKNFNFNPDDFDQWGTSVVINDLEEIQKEGDIPFHLSHKYGLAIQNDICYLYNTDIEKQGLLAITNQFIFGGNHKSKSSNLPYDMYFSPDYKILCLSNRDEGKVYIFDTKTNTFTDDISVRSSGSHKTINVSIAPKLGKIFITDNATTNVTVYDIPTKKMIKKNLGSGILGNICITPNEDSLYVVITKPESNLKSFNPNTFDEIKSFAPKGEYFSLSDDPCDLLTISSDKKYLFSMTYLNEPVPFTPVLTAIDLEKKKAVKRFSIKDETKPITIAFKAENPIGIANKSLEEILVEKGMFTFNKLRDMKLSILAAKDKGEDSLIKTSEESEEENKEEFVEVEQQALEIEPMKEAPPPEYGDGIIPKKTKHVIIPVAANKQIADILIGSFWQQHEIDLTENKEHENMVNNLADSIRRKIEYYDLEIVNKKNFVENYSMETIIQREFILEMLHEEESIKRQQVTSSPSHCMNCASPMYGAWECPVCGFTYEKPEDALRRKIASLEPLANLQKGHFFVLDSDNGILMEVDNYKIPIWLVTKEAVELQSISQAFRLDNKNTLILDGVSGNWIELSPKGRVVWQYIKEDEEKPQTILSNPNSYSITEESHLLVADTENHRVMEMDLDGNIIWQYGITGSEGIEYNALNRPTDFQKTYDETYLVVDSGNNRVIELERKLNITTGDYDLKIIWQYGNVDKISGSGEGNEVNQLNKPLTAYKEIDGKIYILDAGNQRLIQVTDRNEIVWEYNTKNEHEEVNILNPIRFTKLKNKDLLIVGDGKLVQVYPSENKIMWYIGVDQLTQKTTYRVESEAVKKLKAKYGKKAYVGKFGKAKHEEFIENKEKKKKVNVSRYMNAEGQKSTEEINDEKAKQLEEMMNKSKEPSKATPDKPHAITSDGFEPLPMPVLTIDKSEHKVLLLNRKAEILWSYEEKDNKQFRPLYAEITMDKTLLVTDSARVFEVDMKSKKIIWEHPCHARSSVKLKNGNYLIPDERESKVLEVTKNHEIVWEHYCKKPPFYASRLSNNNTLITLSMGHIVEEIDSEYVTVWSFGQFEKAGNDNIHLSYPEHAARLKNGNTLITDTGNSRLIEISPLGDIVWKYAGDIKNILVAPLSATKLKDGHTYIIHANYRQIIEIDNDKKLVWKLVLPSKKGLK
jgi:DNA-binding beta-propeller fold protein YncE